MQIKKTLIATIAVLAPLITLLPQFTPIATAQVLSNCSVSIVGNQRGSRVNMRSGPGTEFDSPGFILVGQVVRMLNDSNGNRIIRTDNQRMQWFLVEYIPSSTRGWVREDFIGPSCIS